MLLGGHSSKPRPPKGAGKETAATQGT